MDFISIKKTRAKNHSQNRDGGTIIVSPDFQVMKSKDLMIRGRSFYAIWDPEQNRWIKDELEVPRIIDNEVMKVVRELQAQGENVIYTPVRDYSSGHWTKYVSFIKNMPDNYKQLDSKIFFANDDVKQTDYSSRKVPYAFGEGSIDAYDELMSTLYDPEERQKLEWSVGAILTGDSKNIQKFIVIYGGPGSGKSTFLNIVQKLVEGYYITFNAKDLVTFNNSFATEVFKNNPLVAIQHDGDLSRIEDNSILNSIISHEAVTINEKHKAQYSMRINCFLYLGTNKPVKITDSKSGLIRRLIDVSPSGRKLNIQDYNRLVKNIDFELGAIAAHCVNVYKQLGPNYYNHYRPRTMMFETNVLYNFVEEYYLVFCNEEGFQLKQLYDMYKQFCLDTGELYPMKRNVFRAEMQTYFREFYDQRRVGDKVMRSYFCGFRKELIDGDKSKKEEPEQKVVDWLDLKEQKSIFDDIYKDRPAQLTKKDGTPRLYWKNCRTKLSDIDTRKLHYILLPENHIVIDFDLKNSNGNKSAELNLKEASNWPETYAEFSKSGEGVHLHYIYNGDVSELKRVYADDIEIKVFTGKTSLRRKLTKCNDRPIAIISSGLPLREKKGGNGVLNKKTVADENHLRVMIRKCLNKEFHGATKPECDFIFKLLEDAYNSGMVYDVTDMRSAVLNFACQSSHQSAYCVNLVNKMKWASKTESQPIESEGELAFFDIEVFKNVLIVVYKLKGKDCVVLINPSPKEVEKLFSTLRLIGYNNLRYDNHILYARYIGYNNEQLYNLSQKLISKESTLKHGFREAYNISYTDVYDFSSEKKSLKRWQIDLGIHHKELEFDFNEELPEKYWPLAVEYCCNDVIATEIVFNERKADFLARCILADLAGGTPNQTTNQLTTKIVFGNDRNPQLNYVHLEEFFPGYEFVRGEDGKMHNMYRGVDLGFGGYVYAEPGIHENVALLDVASMHPTSIIEMNYFGKYTQNYTDLKEARIAIKEGDFEKARTMLGGKLAKYLDDTSAAEDLAYALKIALNSAYGLTSASFINPMRDSRNVNNIVALRGALFMKTLQDEVQSRGFTVAHIKTDSIKIPNATPEIIEFCKEFAKKYGYTFDHEATYEKMCLVNDAVYIAKYKWAKKTKLIEKWTATGAQFAEPYIFKKFFSKEEVIFDDYIQKKSVSSPAVIYLDFDENLPEGEHNYIYVGRVGGFIPVVPGANGGKLYRVKDGSYSAITGTKGYRWKEAEVVKELNQEDQLDITYFHELAKKAIAAISKYGDFYEFAELDNPDAASYVNGDLIGFDDRPHLAPVAQAIILKGDK